MSAAIDEMESTGIQEMHKDWLQHARDVASGYGLALQNTTLDHVLWNFTSFPFGHVGEITTQLHHAFRAMSRGWWSR